MSVAPKSVRQRPSAALPRATPQRATPSSSPTAPRPDSPPRRARRRPLAFLVFASLVVGALVLGLTALNAVLAQGSFRIDDLSHRVDRLQQDYDRKELEVSRLSAPGRIAREAAGLGMALPEPSHVKVIHLRPSRPRGGANHPAASEHGG